MFFNNPFKLMTVTEIAESADSLGRNEIVSSNEFRQILGLRPSDDPKADELRNSNLNHPDDQSGPAKSPDAMDESAPNTEEYDEDSQEPSLWDTPMDALMSR